MKYKLEIAYDGTSFSGWQVQPNALSIQEAIEKALLTITKEPIRIVGAGRTDAGVHALGQVAHFSFPDEIDSKKLLRSLNGLLPPSIRILSITQVPDSFHAQKSARGKIYSYHLYIHEIILPFMRPYMLHVRRPLDLTLLQKALQQFVGTHDFTAFSNSATEGACSKNPVRTISRIEVGEGIYKKPHFQVIFEGNGFLYKMVRNIMGTALEVASQKLPLSAIEEIFKSRDRKKAPKAACANGLFLEKVLYNIP